jgi:nitroreductase
MTYQPAQITAADAISSALSWRYAAKAFDPDRKVSDEDLGILLESIRLAPTSFGLQPFHVVVVSDKALKSEMRKAAYGQPQLDSAPHVLVFVADTYNDPHVEKLLADWRARNVPAAAIATTAKFIKIAKIVRTVSFSHKLWASEQAHLALGFALFTAASLRLDSCPMGGISRGKMRKVLGLPKYQTPVALMALGYRAADDTVHPKYRLPLGELVTFK